MCETIKDDFIQQRIEEMQKEHGLMEDDIKGSKIMMNERINRLQSWQKEFGEIK